MYKRYTYTTYTHDTYILIVVITYSITHSGAVYLDLVRVHGRVRDQDLRVSHSTGLTCTCTCKVYRVRGGKGKFEYNIYYI